MAGNRQPSTNTKTKLDLTKHVGIFTNPRMLLQIYDYFLILQAF